MSLTLVKTFKTVAQKLDLVSLQPVDSFAYLKNTFILMLLFVLRLSVFLVLSIFHLIESFVFSISGTFPKYLWNSLFSSLDFLLSLHFDPASGMTEVQETAAQTSMITSDF